MASFSPSQGGLNQFVNTQFPKLDIMILESKHETRKRMRERGREGEDGSGLPLPCAVVGRKKIEREVHSEDGHCIKIAEPTQGKHTMDTTQFASDNGCDTLLFSYD